MLVTGRLVMITNCIHCSAEVDDEEVGKCEECEEDGLCPECLPHEFHSRPDLNLNPGLESRG